MIPGNNNFGQFFAFRHAVDLFIDFVQVFRRIMIILANKENDKKKRN